MNTEQRQNLSQWAEKSVVKSFKDQGKRKKKRKEEKSCTSRFLRGAKLGTSNVSIYGYNWLTGEYLGITWLKESVYQEFGNERGMVGEVCGCLEVEKATGN